VVGISCAVPRRAEKHSIGKLFSLPRGYTEKQVKHSYLEAIPDVFCGKDVFPRKNVCHKLEMAALLDDEFRALVTAAPKNED